MKNQDYSGFDVHEILDFMFHPRHDYQTTIPEGSEDLMIEVEEGISLGARLFGTDLNMPFVLFFHGNGEIASDYDDLGPIYNQLGINFMVVDYRGYGKSAGTPTVKAMMNDCLRVLDFTAGLMTKRGFKGPLVIMGRSIGSASACEIAYMKQDMIDCLIIESGFSKAIPLLDRLGARTSGIKNNAGFDNSEKLKNFTKPVLIIHAEHDHIIPYTDATELLAALPESTDKKILKIREADHNSIFYYGMSQYMEAVLRIAMKCMKA